jgi:hypothetical protein
MSDLIRKCPNFSDGGGGFQICSCRLSTSGNQVQSIESYLVLESIFYPNVPRLFGWCTSGM